MSKQFSGARINRLPSPFTLTLLLAAVYLSISGPSRVGRAFQPSDDFQAALPRAEPPAHEESRPSSEQPRARPQALSAERFLHGPDDPTARTNDTDDDLLLPRTPDQTCDRALASPIGDASSDGLGHRLTLVLYELNLAAALDVAYLHRVAPYASLTAEDPAAVQRLFGWLSYPHLRSRALRDNCEVRTAPMRGCERVPSDTHEYCARVKRTRASPTSSPSFKRVVRLPQALTDCFANKRDRFTVCVRRLRAFAKRFQACHTLFQAFPSRCSFDYTTGSTDFVLPWLRARYWRAHEGSTRLVPAARLQRVDGDAPASTLSVAGSVSRLLPFRAEAVQVAVHVRRGDLFRYKHRKIIADATFGDVVAAAVRAARALRGADQPVDVSVFSEGAPPRGKNVKRSNHDVSEMTSDYVSEDGTRVENGSAHWSAVVGGALSRGSGPEAAGTDEDMSRDGVRVRAFIATDTVVAIHSMLCADVFVGSLSGLSFIVAGKLARGVIVLPQKGGKRDDLNTRTVYYDSDAGRAQNDEEPLLDEGALQKSLQSVLQAE